MVSLPVHESCFDLNIVYTNMSGVTRGGIEKVREPGGMHEDPKELTQLSRVRKYMHLNLLARRAPKPGDPVYYPPI